MIALSSASYTFENLYKTYKDWVNKIYSDELGDANYFISQMGYEALPEEMIDKTIIEEAQDGGSSHSSFLRESIALNLRTVPTLILVRKKCTNAQSQTEKTQPLL